MKRGNRGPIAKAATPERPRRGNFAALVRAAPTSPVKLPLTHITDAYSFREIMGEMSLIPSKCRVFGDKLVYFFYGRPAYRAAAEQESNGSDAYWPICFVLEPEAVKPKRIFPFDSGAFHYRRFDRIMYHEMIKEDFELDFDSDTPGRLLRMFWRDERSYFNADGLNGFEPSALDFEAKAYLDLIRDTGRAPFDERNSAIEIQSEEPIELPGNTLAVILPHEFATDEIVAKIEKAGALAIPFDVVRRHGPTEMVGQIYAIVRDLLSGKHSEGRGQCW